MKNQALITYVVLFLSGIMVVLMLYIGGRIIIENMLKTNWFSAKHMAESLEGIITVFSSSTYDVFYITKLPNEDCKIKISKNEINVTFKSSKYSEKINLPSYISVNETEINCPGPIIIQKKGNEIIFESKYFET